MLKTTPPKGTQDRYPQEFEIRKYIFDTRRQVCTSFWYQEYLGPLVESVEIWKAKSGEDVGGSELTRLTDRNGEISDLALRPEMTPTVTRMVAKNYAQLAKPVRFFSIANFYRNERPQRGRNREFWQLNVDCFGSTEQNTDLEILMMAMELMKAFNPPKWSRELHINNRFLIDAVLETLNIDKTNKQATVRIMDKRKKLKPEDIDPTLTDLGLNEHQREQLKKYMEVQDLSELVKLFPEISDTNGYQETKDIITKLTEIGYGEYLSYHSDLIRGFDYYDGLVFEIFDTHSDNKRALFGGGRYNGLSTIFIKDEIPAIGFAPGDETMKLFLESRGLLEKIHKKVAIRTMYFPILDENLHTEMLKLAEILRKERNVVVGVAPQGFGKAMKYADKNNFNFVIIYGEQEKQAGVYKVKDMQTGKERAYTFDLKKIEEEGLKIWYERFCSKKLNQEGK